MLSLNYTQILSDDFYHKKKKFLVMILAKNKQMDIKDTRKSKKRSSSFTNSNQPPHAYGPHIRSFLSSHKKLRRLCPLVFLQCRIIPSNTSTWTSLTRFFNWWELGYLCLTVGTNFNRNVKHSRNVNTKSKFFFINVILYAKFKNHTPNFLFKRQRPLSSMCEFLNPL